ncbi:MAG: 3-hydroxyacyl-[acyl-carrier-protein] dehydratase FabZ, partial [Elusimicrobiota bacterium]|nr:3-hydroxyacyl-[acyl-carrier-protein] dehydratase FabZ [Elusimicrobiota bacterium]
MKKTELNKTLPYGDPFLLVDEVKISETGCRGTGIKKLTGDEYFFEGHFPGRPIMPGVLIVEAISQTAMAVIGQSDLKLSGVEKIRFRQTIEPDDILKIDVEIEKGDAGKFKVEGEVVVDRNTAASGTVVLSTE